MKKGWFVVNCARTQSRMRAVSATYRADLSYREYRSRRQVMEELGTQKPAWHCILTGPGIPTEKTLAYPIARGGDIDPGTTISSQEREFYQTNPSGITSQEVEIVGSLASLKKERNRGTIKLKNNVNVPYRYIGSDPIPSIAV